MQASDLKKSVEDELNRSQRQICKLEDERKNALITIKDLETRIQNIEDSVSQVISHTSLIITKFLLRTKPWFKNFTLKKTS